jgi:hypothetical protein
MVLTEYLHYPEETENSYVILTGTYYPNKNQGIGDDTNYIWHVGLQRAGATYYCFDGVNGLSETVKFTAQYIKYRDDIGNFVANDNYYLLNENDIEQGK